MERHPASYRDPSGYIFKKEGQYQRRILPPYFEEYDAIEKAGLYQKLFEKGWLIPHREIQRDDQQITLLPEQIDLITYPYEWSFTQYKHAAQLTLRLQIYLLEKGFSLKDASAFNISFYKGKAIHIDTLSIERYRENEPWKALLQFNQHFLGPLLLAQQYGSHQLKQLMHRIDGIPLKEVQQHLGFFSRFYPTLYAHIHLLAKTEGTTDTVSETTAAEAKLTKKAQLKMLKALELYISEMKLQENSQWSNYYSRTNYNLSAFEEKKRLIKSWCAQVPTKKLMDIGGNDGTFGSSVLENIDRLIVTDIDQAAIDQCYKNHLKSSKVTAMVSDLAQPAPGIGFNNQERSSLIDRWISFKPDTVLALALIHHLTLTNNLPFEMTSAFFARFCPYLIIEFPHREDSWVQYLLDSKRESRHLFDGYEVDAFAKAYQKHFTVLNRQPIKDTHRTLFLLQNNAG